MRIIVDHSACSGHGRCAAVAPEVYELDDTGHNAMSETEVPADLVEAARRGADNCPERAITLVE